MSFGAGNGIGMIISGIIGHFSYKRNVRYPPLIMGLSTLSTCIPYYFLVNNVDENSNVAIVAVVGVATGILSVIPVPIERVILTNVTHPKTRGRANSLLGIVDELGKGLAPVFIALIIGATNRRTAFNLANIGLIISGVVTFVICLTVRKDEDQLQARIAEEQFNDLY